MKTSKRLKAFDDCEDYMMCPLCGSAFKIAEGKSLVCERGHCFDFAAKGYVNFVPNVRRTPGLYSKKLFESRAAVFKSGAYDKAFEGIRDMISANARANGRVSLLDAGCGEGYYAERFSDDHRFNVFALDISKDAILAACKRKAPVKWMSADLTKLPLLDNCMDVIVNILTSANYDEFGRVLAEDGILIKAVPGSDYLMEIREAIRPQLRNPEYSNKDVVEYFEKRVKIIDRRTLCYKAPADAALTARFMEMTPMTFGVETEKADISGISHITINLDVLAGRLQAQG